MGRFPAAGSSRGCSIQSDQGREPRPRESYWLCLHDPNGRNPAEVQTIQGSRQQGTAGDSPQNWAAAREGGTHQGGQNVAWRRPADDSQEGGTSAARHVEGRQVSTGRRGARVQKGGGDLQADGAGGAAPEPESNCAFGTVGALLVRGQRSGEGFLSQRLRYCQRVQPAWP